MGLEENKAIVVCYLKDVFQERQVDLLDSIYAIRNASPETVRKFAHWIHKISTNFNVTILDILAEGNKVAVFVQFDTTYTSKYASEYSDEPHPPLDQPYSWKGMVIYQIVDGKLVSEVGLYDPAETHWPLQKKV
jgi:predicted ester cyclase